MRSTFCFIFSRSAFSNSASSLATGDFHAGGPDLDLVRVHGCVCDEDLCIFEPFWLIYADALVQDEAFVQVAVGELAAGFLDDLDVV